MKLIAYIFLFGVFSFHFTFSQTPTLDSLHLALKNATSDSAKIKVLGNISWEYLNNRSSPKLAKKYIDSLYAFAKEMDHQHQIATAHYQYGVLERQKGNYDAALSHLNQFLDFHKSKEDKRQIANGLYQNALIYDDKGLFDQSSEIYYGLLKIYKDLKDPYSVATIQNAIGDLLKKNDKIEEAMARYMDALKTFSDLGAKGDIANVLYNIGGIHTTKKSFDDALDFFRRALSIDQEIESLWGMAYDYEAIGNVYTLQENYGKALEVHLKALGIREQLQQKKELAESHTHVGTDYFKLKDYQKAQFHLEKAVQLVEHIGANSIAQQAYKTLSELYEAMSDFQKALLIKNKYIAVKDSLFNETTSRQIQELQVKFDSEKKQDAIIALQKDAEIKDLILGRQKTIRNIVIGIAVVIFVFIYILFNRYRRKQKEKRKEDEKKRLLEAERHKTQIEKQRVQELQKIDRLKDEFLANTSHELRTPLHGIIGLSESLRDGAAGKLTPKAMENLDMISNSGRRLSHLVNDILDFSKLKNSDLVLAVRPLDIRAITEVVLKLSEPLIIDKKLKLINSVPGNAPLVEADENRVQQIMHNLIGNAIKFTENGQVEIRAQENNGMLGISISDTGIGIPREKFDTIFRSFEQGDGSMQRDYGGTGLGLSVSKQLVELHGGTLEVESRPAIGSTFTFTLPLSTKTRSETPTEKHGRPSLDEISGIHEDVEEKTALPISPNNGLNILVVDDELINRRVLENHLTLAGYKVTEATNGKDALKLIERKNSFDLILLDVMMPAMSGYEVCQIIRKKYLTSELPIVLLTAKNRVSDLVTGFNVGANDYLTKPFSKNELLSRIKTHINLNGIHKASNKFVPTEFIKSVGREAITDVLLGDFVEKKVTVLFTDIREYTHLSESMTPKQNFKFVNAYVGKMGPLIQKNKGFVNQYLGDGIMALFPEETANGLQAAIDMQRAVQTYNERRANEGFIPISVGMGLHTGPLVMGIIGDSNRNDTAIIADTVNTASRMEGVTKYYGAKIIISEDSLKTITNENSFHLRYLGQVRVKGKDKAIGIYECFDSDDTEVFKLKVETLNIFEKGVTYFMDNQFEKAVTVFNEVSVINPEDAVAKYFASISSEYLLDSAPSSGKTVHIMNQK